MATRWIPTQEDFDRLLAWLDADRDLAGRKYEDIRHSLIKIFSWRGCRLAEELADEAINRVMQKAHELAESYQGDPALYFYGVGRKLLLEYQRSEYAQTLSITSESLLAHDVTHHNVDQREALFACLERCLQRLSEGDRNLILLYYQKERQAKIDFRREVAQMMGIAMNALRVRVHRIRHLLYLCITDCMEEGGDEMS